MWSKKFEKCIECGTTERKYLAIGLCTKCYDKKKYKNNYEKNREKNLKKRRDRYNENPEKVKESCKKYCEKNPEKIKERSRLYYRKNCERIKEYQKKHHKENPEKKKESDRRYRTENQSKIRKAKSIYQKANREKHNLSSKKYRISRCNNFHYKIRNSMSSSICTRLKSRLSSKKGKSTFSFLPYTINDLIQHIESLFEPGMTWENYGLFGWHIDHKRPDCSFNYKSVEDEEFQKCWALNNLQPLWAIDNLKKSNSMPLE